MDGCSGGMSKAWQLVLRRPPPWEGCCDDHDFLYAAGGPRYLRRIADRRLRDCVKDAGYPGWAWAMFYAVRFFGGPHFGWPFWESPFRWGFDREPGVGYTDIGA